MDIEFAVPVAAFHSEDHLLSGAAIRLVIAMLQIGERIDWRSRHGDNAIAPLHARGGDCSFGLGDDQSLGNIQMDADGFDIRRAIEMRHVVNRLVLLAMQILEVADQVALDALTAREGAVHKHRIVLGGIGGRARRLRQSVPFSMQFQAFGEREFDALEVQIGVGSFKVPTAIAHVNLLVGVE